MALTPIRTAPGPWTEQEVRQMPLQGFQKLLGIELMEIRKSEVTARVPLGDHLMNSRGGVHGGALISIADSLGGVGAVQNLGPDQFTSTLESKTNFLAGARGDHLIVRSRAMHTGRRTSVWSIEIYDQAGRMISATTQTQLHFSD